VVWSSLVGHKTDKHGIGETRISSDSDALAICVEPLVTVITHNALLIGSHFVIALTTWVLVSQAGSDGTRIIFNIRALMVQQAVQENEFEGRFAWSRFNSASVALVCNY
jgi:hypothetical protein